MVCSFKKKTMRGIQLPNPRNYEGGLLTGRLLSLFNNLTTYLSILRMTKFEKNLATYSFLANLQLPH